MSNLSKEGISQSRDLFDRVMFWLLEIWIKSVDGSMMAMARLCGVVITSVGKFKNLVRNVLIPEFNFFIILP